MPTCLSSPALWMARAAPHAKHHVRIARVGDRCAKGVVARSERVGCSVRHVDHDVVAPGRREELHVSLFIAKARTLFAGTLGPRSAHAILAAGRGVTSHFQRRLHRVQPPSETRDARGPQRTILYQHSRLRVAPYPAVTDDVEGVVAGSRHAGGDQRLGHLLHVRFGHQVLVGEEAPAVPMHGWKRRNLRRGLLRLLRRRGGGGRRAQ